MKLRRDQRVENREERALAFTLPELLVVIAIGILLLAIAVPAFSSVLYSSRKSGAAASVESALAAARNVALESGPGRDAAAVFFADRGGRLRIMVAVRAGAMQDPDEVGSGSSTREIFVRSERVEPVTLPAGWAVSGRARPNMIGADQSRGRYTAWYTDQTYPDTDQDNWIYPETAFYDIDNPTDGRNRQTFMIRFEGGSGALTYGADEPVLVLDPAPTRQGRGGQHNPLDETDQRRFVQRVLASRTGLGTAGGSASSIAPRILGDESRDTVLARPVGQVAVYSMRRLAAAVEARRLNPATGSLYGDPTDPGVHPTEPKYDVAGKSPREVADAVNAWISNQPVAGVTDSDAQIFTVQRYLGRPLEAVAIGEAPQ